MEKVTIHEATRQDLTGILEIYAQPDLDNGQILPLAEAERIFEKISSYPWYRVYVARQAERIVGTFALLIMDNLAHMGAPSGIVEDIAVAPAWQGRGIGKQMMRYAMMKCQEAGCYKLALSSNRKRVAAHEFYRELGFEQHGYSFIVSPRVRE
jgi:GNAT superfamily N-acetyltransferase